MKKNDIIYYLITCLKDKSTNKAFNESNMLRENLMKSIHFMTQMNQDLLKIQLLVFLMRWVGHTEF